MRIDADRWIDLFATPEPRLVHMSKQNTLVLDYRQR